MRLYSPTIPPAQEPGPEPATSGWSGWMPTRLAHSISPALRTSDSAITPPPRAVALPVAMSAPREQGLLHEVDVSVAVDRRSGRDPEHGLQLRHPLREDQVAARVVGLEVEDRVAGFGQDAAVVVLDVFRQEGGDRVVDAR